MTDREPVNAGSERVDFYKLRGRTSLHRPGDEHKFVGIMEGEMRALVEAVEAAEGFLETSDLRAQRRLQRAIDRFDFSHE
jgi:hypothetical protein